MDRLNAADGSLTCVGHPDALPRHNRENGEAFLTMDAFHGIPSSNLLDDGQSVSRERLHDMFSVQLPGIPRVS